MNSRKQLMSKIREMVERNDHLAAHHFVVDHPDVQGGGPRLERTTLRLAGLSRTLSQVANRFSVDTHKNSYNQVAAAVNARLIIDHCGRWFRNIETLIAVIRIGRGIVARLQILRVK